MYETSYVDDRTGRTVTAPLPSFRIRPGAVPSKFPACPSYFSKESTSRESPDSKRKRFEAEALQAAIAESAETSLCEEEADRIACIRDLAFHLRNRDSTFWHIIENKERLVIVHIVEDEAPWIKYSLVVKADMGTTFHFMKKPTTTLGRDLCVPATAESKRAVMEFLDGVQAWDSNTDSPSKEHTENNIEAICFLLIFSSPKLRVVFVVCRQTAPLFEDLLLAFLQQLRPGRPTGNVPRPVGPPLHLPLGLEVRFVTAVFTTSSGG
ncbi:hypothetical protein MRX96_047366 [Rhipicephalus microplus]